MICDVRAVDCPLAFVRAKQALIKNEQKVFLFDDGVSLYNFCNYLEKENIVYTQTSAQNGIKVELTKGN